MLKQKILVIAILLTFGVECYCSTTGTSSKTSGQSSTESSYTSVSTNKDSSTNSNNTSSSELSSSTTSAEVISTNPSTVSTSTETVSTNVTTGSPSSTEVSASSSISSTNLSSTTSGVVKDVTTDGINASSSNVPASTINTTTTEGTTITSKNAKSQPTSTKTTTKDSTSTTNNINGPSKNKGEPMSLEEKQRRNGIVSASICVGSLVLIGIAYLSSFVDKPSEKVPKFQKTKYNREETNYKSQTKPAGTKKISFDNEFSIQETPTTSSHQPNLKFPVKTDQIESPIKTDQIESPIKTDQIELNSVENNDKNIQNENRRRTGWDVLSKDPAYFDNYQPKNTTTQAEVNEM